jgi:AraC-like DNA-binding protein
LVAGWETRARKANYNAGALARQCGFCLRQLERFFQETKGIPPRQWLLALRLADAAARLRAGVPIKQVAVQSGFASLSAFYRAFKRQFGVTPLEYELDGKSKYRARVPEQQ